MLFPLQHRRCALVSSPSRHLFPFLPPPRCGHPSPSHPSSSSLHHPLAAISKELAWVRSETPAPSEAGQAACGPGQTSLSSGPIYFAQAQPPPAASGPGAGSPGTQLHSGVVPGSCPSVLDPGWSSSSCSAALPTAAAPCRELGAAEAAWPPGICRAVRAPRCWKLLLAMATWGCCTSALQCQESCGQPWIR